jgi:hypothetical protein
VAAAPKVFGADHQKLEELEKKLTAFRRLNAIRELTVSIQGEKRAMELFPLLRRLLTVQEKSYYPDYLITADPIVNLARVLKETDHPVEARKLLVHARRIYERCYGDKSAQFLDVSRALAALKDD